MILNIKYVPDNFEENNGLEIVNGSKYIIYFNKMTYTSIQCQETSTINVMSQSECFPLTVVCSLQLGEYSQPLITY